MVFFPDAISNGLYFPFPYDSILSLFLQLKEADINPTIGEIFSNLASNLGLFAGLVSSSTIVIGALVAVGLWLRKSVTKGIDGVRDEFNTKLEKNESETKTQIEANRSHIEEVKNTLGLKIDLYSQNINSKLEDNKGTTNSIARTMEKISNKLDENIHGFHVNRTRLDNQEKQIDDINYKMMGTGGYDSELRRIRRRQDHDSRYSLSATHDEVEEEEAREKEDENAKNKEFRRRKEETGGKN